MGSSKATFLEEGDAAGCLLGGIETMSALARAVKTCRERKQRRYARDHEMCSFSLFNFSTFDWRGFVSPDLSPLVTLKNSKTAISWRTRHVSLGYRGKK